MLPSRVRDSRPSLRSSNVDWGTVRDLKNNLEGDFRWSATNSGNSMAHDAAAAALSLGERTSDFSVDQFTPPSSRFDPKGVTFKDPVGEEGKSVIDAEEGTSSKTKYARVLCLRVLITSIAIVVILGAAVGISVLLNRGAMDSYQNNSAVPNDQQRLLEIAEEVVVACSEEESDEDLRGCKDLCRGHMCCFVEEEEYSCEDDTDKDCPVYAGCDVLIEHTLVNETEGRVLWVPK